MKKTALTGVHEELGAGHIPNLLLLDVSIVLGFKQQETRRGT